MQDCLVPSETVRQLQAKPGITLDIVDHRRAKYPHEAHHDRQALRARTGATHTSPTLILGVLRTKYTFTMCRVVVHRHERFC